MGWSKGLLNDEWEEVGMVKSWMGWSMGLLSHEWEKVGINKSWMGISRDGQSWMERSRDSQIINGKKQRCLNQE